MLLVHHDRAEPHHRGEHRRARSHRDPSLAAAQGTPGVSPLAVRQSGMQDRHLVTEDSAHPRDRLGRERNLRYEDDRPLSGGHQAPQNLEIHQRLARPGDTLDQDRRLDGSREDPLHHATLVGGEFGRRRRRQAGKRVTRLRHVVVAPEPLVDDPLERRRRKPQTVDQVSDRRGAADRLQRLVGNPALGRALEYALPLEQRRQCRRQHQHPLRRLARPFRPARAPQAARQQGAQGQAERRSIVTADPHAEREQGWCDGRLRVGRAQDWLRRHSGRRCVDCSDDSHHLPPLQRHDDARAWHDAILELEGDLVGVIARNGDGEDDFGVPRLQPRLGAYG